MTTTVSVANCDDIASFYLNFYDVKSSTSCDINSAGNTHECKEVVAARAAFNIERNSMLRDLIALVG